MMVLGKCDARRNLFVFLPHTATARFVSPMGSRSLPEVLTNPAHDENQSPKSPNETRKTESRLFVFQRVVCSGKADHLAFPPLQSHTTYQYGTKTSAAHHGPLCFYIRTQRQLEKSVLPPDTDHFLCHSLRSSLRPSAQKRGWLSSCSFTRFPAPASVSSCPLLPYTEEDGNIYSFRLLSSEKQICLPSHASPLFLLLGRMRSNDHTTREGENPD